MIKQIAIKEGKKQLATSRTEVFFYELNSIAEILIESNV